MSRNKSVSLVTVTIILLFELCTILHGEDEVTEGEERELLHLKDTYYFFVFYPYIPSLSIEMYRDPRILCFDSDAKDDGYVSI
jgi:hypothetical protein